MKKSTITKGNPKVQPEQVKTRSRFKSFIESMVPGVRYEMPENFPYKWLEIDLEKNQSNRHGKNTPFSYSAERNYYVTGTTGYVFPTKGRYVKFWSKEETAKANLFKDLSWMYTSSGIIQAEYDTKEKSTKARIGNMIVEVGQPDTLVIVKK